MRNSTAENAQHRLSWLEDVLAKKISIQDHLVPSLRTMRSFCGLTVNGRFKPIAYNTLKNAVMSMTGRTRGHQNWLYFVELRQNCHDVLKAIDSEPVTASVDPSDINSQSLLDAHICSMAYVEILNFLEKLTSQPGEMSARTQLAIQNQLAVSREKFKSLMSYEEVQSTTNPRLKLVNK